MPLSKHYLDTNVALANFLVKTLADALYAKCPSIQFAYLLGSGQDGYIKPHSDLDLAIHNGMQPATWELRNAVSEICHEIAPGIRCDLGFLDHADSVYRFEALKSRCLFVRDKERWLDFYSNTCREYETTMVHYRRQLKYRQERAA